MLKYLIIGLCLLSFFSCEPSFPPVSENQTDLIRFNQVGYYPDSPKKFVVVDEQAKNFYLLNQANELVLEADLSPSQYWEIAGEKIKLGDFSTQVEPGTYHIYVPKVGYSAPFEIRPNIYAPLLKSAIKSFYYQRMSTALDATHAGQWNRPASHPDQKVSFHPSTGRNGSDYQSPGGWFDAGDFNKYTVNGAFSTGQLLALYETFPELIQDKELNIPESGNNISDFLDEIRYELEWLLTMQDEDGGCFHKVTAKSFEGMIMPHEAKQERFVVGKGTAASLNFAACMAKASRVFSEIDETFAAKCLKAAEKAWDWSIENPKVAYSNPEDIKTGEYGDTDFEDEFYWAAAEIYTANESATCLGWLLGNPPFVRYMGGDSWRSFMVNMGVITILQNQPTLPNRYWENVKQALITVANEIVQKIEFQPYRQPLRSIKWGSNGDLLNATFILAQAHKQTLDKKYKNGIAECLDYVLGRNATGYCFVTGFGNKSPMHIHHRQSFADGIEEPIPGFIVGGPNVAKEDQNEKGVDYPKNAPALKCYTDQVGSYASNEVCLNWNAPLVFALGYMEANTNE